MTLELATPPRHFVPDDLDAGDPAAVEALFDALRDREIADVAALETWLRDESELLAAIAAEVARRYIAMTCDTESEETRARFLAIERDVTPRVKMRVDELHRRVLEHPRTAELDPRRYGLLLKRRRAAIEIFRPENTALETEESELQTRQQARMGKVSVEFRGRAHTLQQMAPYYEDQDRALREAAYRASLEARRGTWAEMSDLLDQLLALRGRIAANAGFDSYAPFRFRQLQRFDYGPDDCRALHDAIERTVVPAVARLDEQRRTALGVDRLRPWDLEVDPDGRPPLRPFESEAELIDLVRRALGAVDGRFADEFDVLRQRDLLDLMSRPGKAPGGYQYQLEDIRLPFIFTNAVGLHGDVQTMLHEGGHAIHSILSRDEALLDYRDAPIEFAETASMTMELLGLERLGECYSADDARRARRTHLQRVLRLLPWIASIDAFQLWLYDHPGHDRDARTDAWLELRARFGPAAVDWSGVEDGRAWQWAGQPHLYTSPLYYVEYAIAQLASLQIWRNYRRDPDAAIAAYRHGLSLGGTQPLPQLFEAAGARFDLSAGMLSELVAEVETALT